MLLLLSRMCDLLLLCTVSMVLMPTHWSVSLFCHHLARLSLCRDSIAIALVNNQPASRRKGKRNDDHTDKILMIVYRLGQDLLPRLSCQIPLSTRRSLQKGPQTHHHPQRPYSERQRQATNHQGIADRCRR